jgi:hypothetical protein
MKRRYASMYAPPVEEGVIEDGTIEGANQYRNDTPGQEEVELEEKKKEMEWGFTGKWWEAEKFGKFVKDKWTVVDGQNRMLHSAKSKGEAEKSAEKLSAYAKDGNMSKFSLGVSNPYTQGGWNEGAPELAFDKIFKDAKRNPDQITVRKIDNKDIKYYAKIAKTLHKDYDYKNLDWQGNPIEIQKEETDIDEGTSLQVKMALGDVGLKGTWKNGKVYVKKRDVKKAEKALKGNVIYRGKPPIVVGEEVEIDEARKPTRTTGMECMECGKKFRTKLSTLQYGKTKCPKCKSTDLDFAFGESVEEEVEVDEQQIDEKGTAYPATIDTLRMIVKDKQHQTVMFKSGKAMVDLFTASAMVQVYDALKKPDMKKTFEKMIADKAGFMKTQAFAMKMIG